METSSEQMVLAWQLYEFCAGDPLGHVAGLPHVDVTVGGAMQDQRRHADERQACARPGRDQGVT